MNNITKNLNLIIRKNNKIKKLNYIDSLLNTLTFDSFLLFYYSFLCSVFHYIFLEEQYNISLYLFYFFIFSIMFSRMMYLNIKAYLKIKKELKGCSINLKKAKEELQEEKIKMSDNDLNYIFKSNLISKEDFHDIFKETINKRIEQKITGGHKEVNNVHILNNINEKEKESLIENF